MASLIVDVDSIINIYDHFKVTPVGPVPMLSEGRQISLTSLLCVKG